MSDIFFFVGIVGAQAAVCALLIWLVGKVCSSRCANRHLLVFIIYSVLLGVLTLFGGEFFFLFYPLLNLVFIIHATVLGGVIGWTLIKKKSIKLTILGIVTFIASPLLTIMPPSYAYYRILEGFENVKWLAYSEDLGGGYRMTTYDGIYYKENEEDNGGQMVIPGGCVNCAYNNQWIIVKTKAPLGFQKQPQKNTELSVPPDSIVDYWIIDKSVPIDLNDKEKTYGHLYYALITYLDDGTVMVRWKEEEESRVIASSVTGPLDSLSFQQELTRLSIPLTFKK